MPENEVAAGCESQDCFKEAVCIDTMKIYDSCGSKDCIQDIRVLFPAARQPMIDLSYNVWVNEAIVLSV